MVGSPSLVTATPGGSSFPVALSWAIRPSAMTAVAMSSSTVGCRPAGHRHGQRAGGHGGAARPGVRHVRHAGHHADRGHPGVGGLAGVVPDGAGVHGAAHRRPADAALAGAGRSPRPPRGSSRPGPARRARRRSRWRPAAAATVGTASGSGFALVEQLEVPRHPGYAVRVDAPQVGPDQRVGHGGRVRGPARGEDAGHQGAQVIGPDPDLARCFGGHEAHSVRSVTWTGPC